MKPLIYFDFEECRLEEILDEVYQAGYEDGNAKQIPTYPYNIMINKKPTINSDDLGKMSDIEFTCKE